MDRTAALVAAIASFALLAASVSAGLRVPTEETLDGLPSTSTLDYSRLPRSLSPLSPEFISKALGLEPRSPASPTATARARLVGRTDATRTTDRPVRTVVEHGLTNDDLDDAYAIDSIPFTARATTVGATRAGDPGGCSPVGPTVWYRYRPPRDGTLIASTIGTHQATSLAVFTGADVGHLTQVKDACNSSVQGNAYVTVPAQRGTTYYFQITSLAGGGPFVFNLDPSGTTEMVSLNREGKTGDSSSGFTVISTGGRYVLFTSAASDLVEGDTNEAEDVFVRDLVTGTTERVSVSTAGLEGNRESKPWPGAISADGRFVAFTSSASNLVAGDTNDAEDVFVRDRVRRETTRVSVSSSGRQGQDPSDPASIALRGATEPDDDAASFGSVSISADGRLVAFDSELVGLVPEDGPEAENETGFAGRDVFVHDRLSGRTRLVSRSSGGANADALSLYPDISADGRFVAFGSSATNLIDGEAQTDHPLVREATALDVFVHELATSRTERVSVSTSGRPANGQSFPPSISPEGRYVAFASVASDLIEDDTNEGMDVFVRDRWLGRTERVSVTSTGEEQQGGESVERAKVNGPKPDMSWDGRYVVFSSDAVNLVPRDTNGFGEAASGSDDPKCGTSGQDVFLRDRIAGTTTRVSVSSSGTEANAASNNPSISADGRRIAFDSFATNLVAPGVDEQSELSPVCYHSSDSFVHTIPVLH